MPFLVQHGDLDRVCHVKGSQLLLAAASSADKELRVYPVRAPTWPSSRDGGGALTS